MKKLITRESVIKEVRECFDRLEREIEEHCVMHDSVLARSKCINARNMLYVKLNEMEAVATLKELDEKMELPEYCEGCERLQPQITVERYKSTDGGYGEISSVTCAHSDICRYQHERFQSALARQQD